MCFSWLLSNNLKLTICNTVFSLVKYSHKYIEKVYFKMSLTSFLMSLGPLYVLLGEVSVQVLCPFFNWVICLPGVESCEFFVYFGDQTLVQSIIYKYIFQYGWFPFHFADVFFSRAETFLFWWGSICLFFPLCPLLSITIHQRDAN